MNKSNFFKNFKFNHLFKIAGVTVTNQPFGEATSLAAFFTGRPMDGICGLGFQALAVDRVIPPVQNMIQQNLLDNPWFTVWMTA